MHAVRPEHPVDREVVASRILVRVVHAFAEDGSPVDHLAGREHKRVRYARESVAAESLVAGAGEAADRVAARRVGPPPRYVG